MRSRGAKGMVLAVLAAIGLLPLLLGGGTAPRNGGAAPRRGDEPRPPAELPPPSHPGGARVARMLTRPEGPPEAAEVARIDFTRPEAYADVLFTPPEATQGEQGVLVGPKDYWVKVEVPFGLDARDVDLVEFQIATAERVGGMVTWRYEGANRRRPFSMAKEEDPKVIQVPLSADRYWSGSPERITIQFRGLENPLEIRWVRFLSRPKRRTKPVELAGRTLLAREVSPGETIEWEVALPEERAFLMVSPALHVSAGKAKGSVEFAVTAKRGRSEKVIFEKTLRFGNEKDAGWNLTRVSLEKYHGRRVRLAFHARIVDKVVEGTQFRILWGNPQIVTPPGPNGFHVVLIGVDTLRRDYLSCYGYRFPTSPRIDRMASEGALFENAVSTSPWTLPSFASILSGQYPSTHGAGKRTGPQRKGGEPPTAGLRKGVVLFPEILKSQAGFRTGFFFNNPYLTNRYGLAQGFEKAEQVRGGGWKTVNAALGWMNQNLENRMFVFLHLLEPHRPYSPPDPYKKTALDWFAPELEKKNVATREGPDVEGPPYQKTNHREEKRRRFPALYSGEILYTDHLVGKFLDGLDQLGILDNTLIIFTADHGEEFGEHDSVEQKNYNDPRGFWGYGHGHSQFQELVAAPLIVRFPGRVAPGTRVESLVQVHDIAPSVLEWVGLKVPSWMAGLSMLPALEGAGLRGFAYTESILYGDDRISYQDGKWKLIFGSGFETCELYDLEADPGETRNLRDDRPKLVREMSKHLHEVEFTAISLGKKLYPEVAGEVKAVEVDEETRKELKSLGYID